MLTIPGLRNFYFVPKFTDMRCKAPRMLEIIHSRFGRDPYNGDVFIFMSKDRRRLCLIHFEDHAYYMPEKSFTQGYKYMKIQYAELAALQSDGYNAYNYIDGQLVKIEHICCLAHVRAKFKYAQEQGQDERATYFLERIARLYLLEGEYKRLGLSFDEIKSRRSSSIHFASHRGAEVSAIFHTVFSTCRMVGVSALDYLKKFFEAMQTGRTDYENLLPTTIGLGS